MLWAHLTCVICFFLVENTLASGEDVASAKACSLLVTEMGVNAGTEAVDNDARSRKTRSVTGTARYKFIEIT